MQGPPIDIPLRLLFWESTSRCNLRCAHCRRLDVPAEPPIRATGHDDLSTQQASEMILSASKLGKPIIVFSGGEPLLRPDWQELAQYARDMGLPTALATNGTMITPEIAGSIARAGFERVSVSVDAPQSERHDAFRGVAGAFRLAMDGIAGLRSHRVSVQINATIYAGNVGELDEIYELARDVGARAFHLFVLVPVGCGLELADSQQLSAQQCEAVLEWVCERQAGGELELKATCAPQLARVARQWLTRHADHPGAAKVRAMLRGRGCLGGVGVIFVSHSGEVFPCGYLPQSCGNVLREPLDSIWRNSPPLLSLRDFDKLSGKCGRCEFRSSCGGCRARAYAATGDMLSAEPICPHQPAER